MECVLIALPRRGTLGGRVTDEEGAAVSGASVTVVSATGTEQSLSSDVGGAFTQELEAGTFTVRVEAEGFLMRGGQSVEVRSRERTNVDVQLRRQPRRALVRVRGDRIQILRPVHFRTDSAEIDADSNALIEQIADVMLRTPELCRIEIQGHTDNRGGREHNQTLSEQRAQSVVDFLVRMGVSGDRLTSRGVGMDRPVAPNFTARGRSQNRRTELHITERCPATP